MYPEVIISEEGAKFLDSGQEWMYRNNLVRTDEKVKHGEPADIVTESGRYIGTGFYNEVSHVAVRILTRQRGTEINREFFERKIRFAYAFRKTVENGNLSNCRLIFSEADGIPGLICDRYEDLLVCQISSYGLEMIKDEIYGILMDVLKEDGQEIQDIYERNDVKVREKEGLTQYKGFYYGRGDHTRVVIDENGLKLNVDVENGQKTGYFLDQKSNRVLVRKIAHGKTVCDCFTHTGGFALNAALGNAKHVTAVDVSKTALDQGYENAKLNGLEERIDFVQADVFDYLDELKPNQFDIIILDPPAFTKSRRTVDHAFNGYKKINKKAMEVLRGGGYLVTCSCSRFMETANFEKMLKESAKETGVTLKQISVTQQNADHPILWTMEETSYLKFYIFQVL